ncbi:MAG TPA: hypothetical protein VGL84_09860 [Gaiellaceae bacterium]|jgi:hypothetical protein
MHALSLRDIESFEAISRDAETCAVCLRMGDLSKRGRLKPFLRAVEYDDELDDETKATLVELSAEPQFLSAFGDYVRSTRA